MKVVAILQNQWFKDPVWAKQCTERFGREKFLARTLFYKCKTGRVLMDVFGEEWVNSIVWEEASPVIGSHASSVFPADIAHVRAVMDRHKPTVVLAFGKVAQQAVAGAWNGYTITAPHPCARHATVMNDLAEARRLLDSKMNLAPVRYLDPDLI